MIGDGIAHRPPPDSRPRRATVRFMLSHPLHVISLGFGSGLSPLMPGTFGTLFAWLSFAALAGRLTVAEWGALIAVGFVAGVGITGFTAKRLGAFFIFRFFDMVKPPPIRYFDQHFSGGFGIMIDDLVAAFLTLLVIALWRMTI